VEADGQQGVEPDGQGIAVEGRAATPVAPPEQQEEERPERSGSEQEGERRGRE